MTCFTQIKFWLGLYTSEVSSFFSKNYIERLWNQHWRKNMLRLFRWFRYRLINDRIFFYQTCLPYLELYDLITQTGIVSVFLGVEHDVRSMKLWVKFLCGKNLNGSSIIFCRSLRKLSITVSTWPMEISSFKANSRFNAWSQ